EGLAAGGAVEGDVADDDVVLGLERRRSRREDDEPSAREALTPVVVGVALQRERHAAGHEGAEGLAGRAGEVHAHGVVGQPTAALKFSRSTRPIISAIVRKPSWAMYSRTSSATKRKNRSSISGVPVKRLRSSGSCVATPTGQVFRWQTRIMMQPMTTSGAVEKPYSSAPSSAATTTSRPVFIWPSVWTMIRSRSLFITRTCWVSASPSSHGVPPCLIEVSGEAPVPPSWPEISTTSEWAFATPAATVPTPTSETSLTLIRARGFPFFSAWMSWARSSME